MDTMDLWALGDLSTPWCIHVVATLRIANHLRGGIGDIDKPAGAAGADPRSLAAEAGLNVHASARQESGRFVVDCRPAAAHATS